MNNHWTVHAIFDAPTRHEGIVIALLTTPELERLRFTAPDTELISIDGKDVTAATADLDQRYGFVAYGIPVVD